MSAERIGGVAGDVFGFHVPRVCRIRSARDTADWIPQASEAFRTNGEDVVTAVERLREGALALPSVVAAAGAMVVLGEPGAGKTSVLTHLTNMLPRVMDAWDGDTDACLWVAGGDLTENSYQEELGCHLSSLPSEEDAAGDTGVLTVVLDQVDESPVFLPYLPRWLKRSLRGRDTSRVRFLLACRTADYPATMTSVLTEAFGTCRCVDIAPLSREEAVALADSADVPGEELVAAAEAAGAAVMASIPMTLELLVLTYRVDGRLHGKPEELFASGVARLAEDPDPRRLSRSVITTAQQRLTVAGRIAAWMLLSGHRTVWRGPAFEAGAFDLPGDALAGGSERTAAGPYEVTFQALQETLATALFTRPDDSRVAFRHSSVAAYLAARYLTDRETTQRQLENLFLVGAPDGGTASIPVPLRETAAWLVAMNPTATDWLAAADPESLAVHSALVRSDEVRWLTVNRLLERALQVELSDARWQLSHWDLRHPLLADQLAEVLETAPSEGPADWETTAQIRLAIRLAQEAGTAHPRLADGLLRLVENEAWHQTERRLAASAAFTCDADRSVPVLKRILALLDGPSYAAQTDPEHDLRGTVLSLLWPGHLDVATMLAALRPPTPHTYNMYAHFLRNMPSQCADEHLPDLLTWVQETVLGMGSLESGFYFSPERVETALIDPVIDRVLGSQDAAQFLETLAKIILGLYRENHKVDLPDCLQPDEQGQESPKVQSLRRLLAQALIGEAVHAQIHPREAAWRIVHDWQPSSSLRLAASSAPEQSIRYQLVDGADFAWALERTTRAAASGDDALVAAYGELAAYLFPRDDREAFELAYDEAHPSWPYLCSFYEAIALDSPLAQALRRSHRAENNLWPQAAEFIAEQARLLAQAREGDNDSLWRFLWRLRVDPRTGRQEDLSGAILTWPGAGALDDELSDLSELALRYLVVEHDHADSWLQSSLHDKRSWAGYALLTELHGANRLTELPPAVWCSWTAAILTEILGMSTSYMEAARRDLLRQAAVHAPECLARRITQLVLAALAQARQPTVLNIVDPRWAPELGTAMERLATELSACLGIVPRQVDGPGLRIPAGEDSPLNLPDSDEAHEAALHTWYSLLRSLLAAGSTTTNDIIDAALDGHLNTPVTVQTAVLAAQALLITDAGVNWPRIKAFTATDAELARRLAEACAHTETTKLIQDALSEAELVDVYLWLSDLYVPEEDRTLLGAHVVSADEQVRKWRDDLLLELSQRATAEAVHQLRQLTSRYPNRLAVAAALISATKQHAAASWSQVRADDVIRVLQDPARRVIRTSTDLLEVVQEVLEEIGEALPSHCELLWDRTPGKRSRRRTAAATVDEAIPDVWRPKPEAALCAYLTHELSLRLAGHRVAVNREVLIHPTDPYGTGDRTDILIDALFPPSDHLGTASGGPIKLVIEVKGAWNPEVMTAQDEQLVARYLPEARTDAGIYLVGWYPIELWDAPENGRRRRAKKLVPNTLLADLQRQAAHLSQAGSVHVRPIVIIVPRPHRQEVAATPS